MRQAGTLSNRDQAQRLADYLLTLDITARVEPDGDAWALWVRDEDHLPQAAGELQQFLADPDNPRYRGADRAAQSRRKQQIRADAQRQKNFVWLRDRWNTRPSGARPLTIGLVAASVLLAVVAGTGEQPHELQQYLWFGAPPGNILQWQYWTGTTSIRSGEIWRLITPIFIHANVFHLLFNMYWLYLFGTLIEIRRGTLRFGLLVLAVAAASNYGQYYFSTLEGQPPLLAVFFGGMSGVNYGLFAYIWTKARFEPQLGMFVSPGTSFILILWLLVCWTGKVGSIANWAHTVGLATGAAIAYAPVAWRRLTRR